MSSDTTTSPKTSLTTARLAASATARFPRGAPRPPTWLLVMTPVVIGFVVLSRMSLDAMAGPASLRLDFSPLTLAPAAVQIHVAAALSAFLVGVWMLIAPKGRGLHKPMGWTWVGLMLTAAISSFFIKSILVQGMGGVSPIHALSAWTVIGLPMGIAAIRRRDVASHRRMMTGMFLGGMGVAGLFTFLPGRLMWSLFFTVQV